MKWMIRTYKSGDVIEKSKFPVSDRVKPRSSRRKGSTTARRQDANDRQAVKRCARSINCNFGHGDLLLTLNYSEEDLPMTRKEAEHDARLFLRRTKNALKKQGKELRYILVTSDMDGDTEKNVRIHHHIVMDRLDFEMLAKLWKKGSIDYQLLRDQKDYTQLAVYLMRQVRRQPDGRKYTVSRGLKKPEITEEIVKTARELRVPKGAVLLHRDEYDRDLPTQYIRYIRQSNNKRRE